MHDPNWWPREADESASEIRGWWVSLACVAGALALLLVAS